jgi:3-hydroxyacyl-CoA dehydrogenase/enoyl-CoA hydratase/3-hydroxybutyryl-CoA epimerase
MSEQHYKNWRLELDGDHILWLYFDKENETVNSFNRSVLEELSQIIDNVNSREDVAGVVFRSGKEKGYIAGADIKELSSFTEVDDAVAFIRFGQKIFDKIEYLKIPSVALIDGFCMGGGTELVLACSYRIGVENDQTCLGLPEVKLGIHPGWGGTVRLPKLIGAPMAMDMILSGRTVSARSAKKMGLLDALVPERHALAAARSYILQKPGKHHPKALQSLTNSFIARRIIANILRKKVGQKAKKEHYPAPYAVIENWARHGVANHDEAMITEANSIGELLLTDTPKNLIRVFNLSEKMKALGKAGNFKPKHVHVIGAGVMGGDIAAWCALRGMIVTLEDREAKYIAPAMGRAYKLFKKKLKVPIKITPVMDRLIPDVDGKGAETADVIIEAIFENLDAKQALFQRLEKQAKPDAILATNTSSIPLEEIGQGMQSPDRLVGIHFFNPVAQMPLVEVVKAAKTSAEVVQRALSFVVKIGRFPIEVKSSPGFLVNRVLMPYMMEAMSLMEEGVPASMIDKVAKDFGMPMGPIELADTVGLDICLSVAKNLSQHFAGKIPERLQKMVEAGHLGRKSGEGFYKYGKDGKAIKEKSHSTPIAKEIIEQRLIDRMLNEAVACYREGVISDLELLDGGMIFGTGFAPFTGGPINYARHKGIGNLTAEMTQLMKQYGSRFEPDAAWQTIK